MNNDSKIFWGLVVLIPFVASNISLRLTATCGKKDDEFCGLVDYEYTGINANFQKQILSETHWLTRNIEEHVYVYYIFTCACMLSTWLSLLSSQFVFNPLCLLPDWRVHLFPNVFRQKAENVPEAACIRVLVFRTLQWRINLLIIQALFFCKLPKPKKTSLRFNRGRVLQPQLERSNNKKAILKRNNEPFPNVFSPKQNPN